MFVPADVIGRPAYRRLRVQTGEQSCRPRGIHGCQSLDPLLWAGRSSRYNARACGLSVSAASPRIISFWLSQHLPLASGLSQPHTLLLRLVLQDYEYHFSCFAAKYLLKMSNSLLISQCQYYHWSQFTSKKRPSYSFQTTHYFNEISPPSGLHKLGRQLGPSHRGLIIHPLCCIGISKYIGK